MSTKKEGNSTTNGKETDKKEVKNKKLGTVVYIGPSIRGVAQKGRIYNNGLPQSAIKFENTCPYFLELFVEVDKLAKAQADLGKKQGRIWEFYKRTQDGLKKEEL